MKVTETDLQEAGELNQEADLRDDDASWNKQCMIFKEDPMWRRGDSRVTIISESKKRTLFHPQVGYNGQPTFYQNNAKLKYK